MREEADTVRKGRVFKITDSTFKILCQADKKNYDPTTGLENLISMYLSLAGPVDFKKLDIERAFAKAKKMMLQDPTEAAESRDAPTQ